MANFSDFYFDSSTGKNRIYVRQWSPEGEPRGIVQIEHGIAEHIERYDDFARFLADNGFIVVGDDHLGHGKSIDNGGEQGFFAESDGWDYVVWDIDRLHDIMSRSTPTCHIFSSGTAWAASLCAPISSAIRRSRTP